MAKPKKWIDGLGQEVPAKYVSAYDKARDAAARRILARFERCREMLETCYCASLQDIEELEKMATANSKTLGGLKGNLQFQSFDGLVQVCRSARYEISFDERLQVARDLIYSVIKEKSSGVDEDLEEIANRVFLPTASGMLSTSRVLELFHYKVKAAKWLQAMDLIRESINTKRGKTLLSCSVKRSRDAEPEPILLDLAKCAGLYGSTVGEVHGSEVQGSGEKGSAVGEVHGSEVQGSGRGEK